MNGLPCLCDWPTCYLVLAAPLSGRVCLIDRLEPAALYRDSARAASLVGVLQDHWPHSVLIVCRLHPLYGLDCLYAANGARVHAPSEDVVRECLLTGVVPSYLPNALLSLYAMQEEAVEWCYSTADPRTPISEELFYGRD